MSNLTNTTNVVNAIRYAVKTRGYWVTFVADNGITRETVNETALELAALAYPSDEPVQSKRNEDGSKTRTRFGNAVQAAKSGMNNVLDKDETVPGTKNLLTSEGKKATKEQVIAEWEAAQK